jgi:hypothetical protein
MPDKDKRPCSIHDTGMELHLSGLPGVAVHSVGFGGEKLALWDLASSRVRLNLPYGWRKRLSRQHFYQIKWRHNPENTNRLTGKGLMV